MSVGKSTFLTCDCCGDWTDGQILQPATARDLRRAAKREGWIVARTPGTAVDKYSGEAKTVRGDICPDCHGAVHDGDRTETT